MYLTNAWKIFWYKTLPTFIFIVCESHQRSIDGSPQFLTFSILFLQIIATTINCSILKIRFSKNWFYFIFNLWARVTSWTSLVTIYKNGETVRAGGILYVCDCASSCHFTRNCLLQWAGVRWTNILGFIQLSFSR